MAAKKIKKTKRKRATKGKAGSGYSFWKQRDLLFSAGAVLAITFIAFLPSLSNEFVNWDDDVNLLKNPNLEVFDWASIKGIFTEDVIGGYNPLSIFTLALERAVFGLNPFVYHLDNLLLHLVIVFFVYRILLLMKLSKMAAFFGALLFGIHPMRVESVAWVTERKDVLFGVFYFAAIFTYIKHILEKDTAQKNKYFRITLLLFFFSLFSKIQAVALPLSLLAIDYYFNRPLRIKLIIEKIPFFAFSLAVGILGIYVLSQSETLKSEVGYGLFGRLAVGAYTYMIYWIKAVFPYEMSPLYPYPSTVPWHYYLGFGFVGAIAVWLYYAYTKNHRNVVFALAFFTFNVMFVLQILGAGQGLLADRFTYVAYFGLFFLLVASADQLVQRRTEWAYYLRYGLGAYMLVFAVMTWNQCGIWKNGGTLWTHVLKFYQKTPLPWSNLGHYYRDSGQKELAIQNYNKAIEIEPDGAGTLNSRGKLYFDSGDAQRAIADYNLAIQADPTIGEIYINRGAAYGLLGNLNKALEDLNKGLGLDPENANGYLNRSFLYYSQQQYEKALADHNTYLRINPRNPEIWYERALCKRQLGRDQDALPDLDQAIRLEARGVFLLERAKIHGVMGNKAQAIADAQAAVQQGTDGAQQLLQQLK